MLYSLRQIGTRQAPVSLAPLSNERSVKAKRKCIGKWEQGNIWLGRRTRRTRTKRKKEQNTDKRKFILILSVTNYLSLWMFHRRLLPDSLKLVHNFWHGLLRSTLTLPSNIEPSGFLAADISTKNIYAIINFPPSLKCLFHEPPMSIIFLIALKYSYNIRWNV